MPAPSRHLYSIIVTVQFSPTLSCTASVISPTMRPPPHPFVRVRTLSPQDFSTRTWHGRCCVPGTYYCQYPNSCFVVAANDSFNPVVSRHSLLPPLGVMSLAAKACQTRERPLRPPPILDASIDGVHFTRFNRRSTVHKVGGDVWCAALLLSTWLLDNPEAIRGLNVLELGSGLGLCGIAAGYLAHSVTLTGTWELKRYQVVTKILRARHQIKAGAGWRSLQRKRRSVA